jgi:hypothetical protein
MDAGNNEVGGETTSILKTLILTGAQMGQEHSRNYLQTLDRATMLGLQRSSLPGTVAGLATASHVPENQPYVAAK